jgi:hypothetical protein
VLHIVLLITYHACFFPIQLKRAYPPSKKMSMYDKWMKMGKSGSLFKKDNQAQSLFGGSSLKPQAQKDGDVEDRYRKT